MGRQAPRLPLPTQVPPIARDSTPKDPRSPFTLHRTTNLLALALPTSPDHPPPTHHDLPARNDDPFIRPGPFDIVLSTPRLVVSELKK
jgi:hypothetical protein